MAIPRCSNLSTFSPMRRTASKFAHTSTKKNYVENRELTLRGLQEIPDDGSKLTARNNNRFSIPPKNTRVRYSTNKLRPSEPRSRLLGNVTQLNHFET